MEKLRGSVKHFQKIVAVSVRFYERHFKCPNQDHLDDDFQKLLQVFYVFGFFQPEKWTKWRSLYGFFMFTFVFLTFMIGSVSNFVTEIKQDHLSIAFLNISGFFFILPMAILTFWFVWNQKNFMKLVKDLHEMHNSKNEALMDVVRKKSLKLGKFYKVFILMNVLLLIVLHGTGLKAFKLFMQGIYDIFADGPLYPFFLTINLIHMVCLASLLYPCDLLLVLMILRIEANVKFLSYDLKNCANNLNKWINDRDFKRVPMYHIKIIK